MRDRHSATAYIKVSTHWSLYFLAETVAETKH